MSEISPQDQEKIEEIKRDSINLAGKIAMFCPNNQARDWATMKLTEFGMWVMASIEMGDDGN